MLKLQKGDGKEPAKKGNYWSFARRSCLSTFIKGQTWFPQRKRGRMRNASGLFFLINWIERNFALYIRFIRYLYGRYR